MIEFQGLGCRAAGLSLLATMAAAGCVPLAVRHQPELPAAVAGERREAEGRAGRLSYYVAGEGPPLLLVHSINAAGSAYEVRPIFERMRSTRRVYAVDLPGFGFSDRSPRPYGVALYVDAILAVADVIGRECGPAPLDALALSLSAEFLARAAVQEPARFATLALVTATGFQRGSEKLRGPAGATREVPGLYRFFTFPLWSQGFYDLLVSRRSIRYFLRKTWGSPDIDEGLAEYDYLTTHQPGAMNAPYAFVSGRLFSKDIRDVYESLSLPVWLPHGTRGDFEDFRGADWTAARPNWTVQPFATGALPQFEQPDVFVRSYEAFLGRASAAAHASSTSSRSPSP